MTERLKSVAKMLNMSNMKLLNNFRVVPGVFKLFQGRSMGFQGLSRSFKGVTGCFGFCFINVYFKLELTLHSKFQERFKEVSKGFLGRFSEKSGTFQGCS